jgi:5-methylcytosine-specific restriction endonuclease McrA
MVAQVLTRPTLVLNKGWQPVAVQTVARALVKVWNETARIVDPANFEMYSWDDWSALKPAEDQPCIITAGRQRLRVPEVVVLTHFDDVPCHTVAFTRRNVFKRDRFTCQYCGRQPGSDELTIDHIKPRSQGGPLSWENCVLACIECNSRKADRTPEQAKMRLRKTPARPTWRPIYAAHGVLIDSWTKFISEAYWNVELET